MIRALDTQRTLEVDACLTGVDAEVTQRDLDGQLRKADGDFTACALVIAKISDQVRNADPVRWIVVVLKIENERAGAVAAHQADRILPARLERRHSRIDRGRVVRVSRTDRERARRLPVHRGTECHRRSRNNDWFPHESLLHCRQCTSFTIAVHIIPNKGDL